MQPTSIALFILRASLFASLASTTGAWPGKGKPVVAVYYPNYWSSLLPPSAIPWHIYNHIDYFVAETLPDPSTALEMTDYTKNMKDVIAGAQANNVSISLTIGGWTGSRYFSSNIGSAANRTAFVKTISHFIRKYGFNGVDIDWEYPNNVGIGCNRVSPHDTSNLLKFLELLRAELGSSYRLSAAVGLDGFAGPDGNYLTDLSGFAKVLDYVTIMAYDMFGPGYFAPIYTTGPNAPLADKCAPSYGKFSGSRAVKTWEKMGFPARKIVLGVPSYGYGYTTISKTLKATHYDSHKTSYLYQNASSTTPPAGVTADVAGKDECGNTNGPGGQWLYRELVEGGKLNGFKGGNGYEYGFDTCSSTAFLFNNATRSFISFDDTRSYSLKGAYAKAAGLAGVNIFDATGDTSDNQLLTALRKSFLG